MLHSEETATTVRYFFRKENRLLKRADFLRVYDKGKAYRRPLLHVFILPVSAAPGSARPHAAAGEGIPGNAVPTDPPAAPAPGPTRLGITVTRKAGNAVKRNRGRRLVRESFRHLLPDLKPGYWIVVNVMRAATAGPQAKVDSQLRDIFAQAGLFKE